MKNIEQYPFFVMLYHPNGGTLPMIEQTEDMAMYDSKEEAAKAARSTELGANFGYEIFEIGYGETS